MASTALFFRLIHAFLPRNGSLKPRTIGRTGLRPPSFESHRYGGEALQVLTANLQHPGHVFWPDDLDFPSALSLCGAKLQGHRQANDAYLLGLALHRKAHVVTLDSGIVSLLPSSPRPATRVIDLLATPRRH